MKIQRRTAGLLCAAAVALSAGAGLWAVTRPDYLRGLLADGLRESLAPGWEVTVGAVDYDLGGAVVSASDIRLDRTAPARETVVRIPRLEVGTRIWSLLAAGRPTDVLLVDPEVLLERDAAGRFPLLECLPASGAPGGGGARPRIRVQGGSVRYRDAGLLAPGEEVRLRIEALDWQESRDGEPTPLEGTLREIGSAAPEGAGALGAVTVRGDLPLGRHGIRVAVATFPWDEALLARLSADLRERLAPATLRGTFGAGAEAPALEIEAARLPDREAPVLRARLRPRGVDLLLRDFPVPLNGVRGDIAWDDGVLRVGHLELFRGGGEIHARGRLEGLEPGAPFALEFWARNFHLDAELREALPPSVRRVWDAYEFSGVVDLTASPWDEAGSFDCSLERPARDAPLEVRVVAQMVDASMCYRGYPDADGVRHGFAYPVDRILGKVTVRVPADGPGTAEILLDGIRGRHGDVEITAGGEIRERPGKRTSVDIAIEARDLALDEDLRRASPIMEGHFRRWSPAGTLARLLVKVEQVAGVDAGAHESVLLELDGRAGFTYEGLPLPITEVSGSVSYEKRLVEGRRVPVTSLRGIAARMEEARIRAGGTVEGADDSVRVRVAVTGIALDGALERVLRAKGIPAAVDVWDRCRPRGLADAIVEVTGPGARPREEFRIDLRGASVEGWGDVAFPVADLDGRVVVTPEAVLLEDIRGTHAGTVVGVAGSLRDPGGAAVLDLALRLPSLPLDGSLRDRLGGLAGRLDGYFAAVRPREGLRGDVGVFLRGPADAVDPEVVVENLRGGIAPLDLRDLVLAEGRARWARGVATLEGLRGTLGSGELDLPSGRIDTVAGDGILRIGLRRVRFPGDLLGLLDEGTVASLEAQVPDRFLHVENLDAVLGSDLRRVLLRGDIALSPRRSGATGGLGLEGAFRLTSVSFTLPAEPGGPTVLAGDLSVERGALEAGVSVRDLAGTVTLGGSLGPGGEGIRARLAGASAKVEGRQLEDAGGMLSLQEGVLLVKDLRGRLAGGEFGANIEVGGKREYEGIVTLSNAAARALFAPTDPTSELRGSVSGSLQFRKPRAKGARQNGTGWLDISEGRLGKVPVFDGIYGIFGLDDRPEFKKASFQFALDGQRLEFSRLDLESDVLAIHRAPGPSTAWIDGRLDLRLTPEVRGVLASGPLKWLTSILTTPLAPLYQNLHMIHVGGTIGKPEVSQVFLDRLFRSSGPGKYVLLDLPRATEFPPVPPVDF